MSFGANPVSQLYIAYIQAEDNVLDSIHRTYGSDSLTDLDILKIFSNSSEERTHILL